MRFDTDGQLPEGWEFLPIESVCSRVTSGGTPSRKRQDFFGGTIPWVKTQELKDCVVNTTDEYITEEALSKSSAKLLPANTVLLAMYGATVGQLGVLGREATCNQACCAFIVDQEKSDYRFLYYTLLANREKIVSLATGAAQQNLSGKTLKSIDLPFPTLIRQKEIAGLLWSIDKKIANNRALAADLEAMARAIFKSWFVDFDPVKAKMEGRTPVGMDADTAALFPDELVESELGLIPKGWEVIPLSEMAEFLNGLALQKYPPSGQGHNLPVLKIAQLRARQLNMDKLASAEVGPRYVVSAGDLIFSWSGSLIVDFWAGPDCALNQHLFKVTPRPWASPGLLWAAIHHHIDQFREIAAGKAVTMGHINRKHLDEAKLALPGQNRIRELCQHLDSFTAYGCQLEIESQGLAQLRNTLLPRLISGKLRVPDIQAVIEEVVA